MKEVSEELLKRIDMLAQKMGTTIDHLWQVLVRQAYVEGYFAIFWIILEVFLVTIAVRYIGKSIDLDKKGNCSGSRGLASVVLAVLTIIFLLTACYQCSDISYLFNPEYYALNQFKSFFVGN